MIEDWDTSLAKHADWVRENYSDRNLSDDDIDGLVDEASYELSFAVRIIQALVLIFFFGWLGELAESIVGAPEDSILGIVSFSFGMFFAFFIWSKSSPLHESLIRWSIRRRLATDEPSD